ncbi:MAG: ABC transporter ATP-binding protein/permease [Bacteroidia bacterium]|nr:ABC transporter ATP-binding protein/permease [Bacteroidia bacterium]
MESYFRIISYGKPFYGQGMLASIFLLIYTLSNTISLVAIIPFLEILFSQNAFPQPEEALIWYNASSLKAHGYFHLGEAIQNYGPRQMLLYFSIFLTSSILIKNISKYLSSYFMAPFEQGIMQELRNHIFKHLMIQDLSFFTSRKKGDLINVILSDVNVVREAIIGTLLALFREPITMVIFILTLLFISWKLTLFTLLVLPLTALVIARIRTPLRRKTKEGQKALGKLVALIDEQLGGIKIIKTFQKESFAVDSFEKENQNYTDFQIGIRRQSELASPLTEVLSILVICAVIYFAGTLILEENSGLKRSEFLGFIAVFSQFISPIKVFANAMTKVQRAIAAFERITGLLDHQPQIANREQTIPLANFSDQISFENLNFAYKETLVLQDINFTLKKGESLALVGPSGSGKSTLAHLMARFYDPQAGAIFLDGHDIRNYEIEELRSLIGMVDQEGILFHSSVKENIAFGVQNPNMNLVMEAAKNAYAHEFIMELPEAYDTLIGDRGIQLSGGQRQRLSIARALLRNPEILILDEATSNLDTQSEKEVQHALSNLLKDRTSIIIAHRLSTIVHANKIIVLKQGKIVEQGTHQELLAMGGLYQELYQVQTT